MPASGETHGNLNAVPEDVVECAIEAANEVAVVPLARMALEILNSAIEFSVATNLTAVVHGRMSPENVTDEGELAGIAERCQNAVLKALAAEACWHMQIGDKPHRFAIAAVREYRELASEPAWLLSDSAEVLGRALTLAVRLNQGADTRRVADELTSLLQRAVKEAPGHDSAAYARLDAQIAFDGGPEADSALAEQQFHDAGLLMLRSLAEHRQSPLLRDHLSWEDVEGYALAAFGDAEGDLTLRRALLDPVVALVREPALRASIMEGQLRAEVAWSETQPYATQYVVRVSTERKARDLGLNDLAHELQRDIQNMDRHAILTPVRTEVPIDGDDVDGVRREFCRQVFVTDDWRTWAKNLVFVGGCPSDSVESLTEAAVAARPLRSALPGLVVGPKAVPVRSDADDADRAASQASQCLQLGTRLFANVLLVPAVAEFVRRVSRLPTEEVAAFFVSAGFDEVRAVHVVGALRLYGAADFDASAHQLLPRVEFLLRERASLRGSVIRPTDGTSRGGVDPLAAVLATLQGHLDERWRQYLNFVLVSDRGLNLRNEALHGLQPEVTESDAAILVHVLLASCFLPEGGVSARANERPSPDPG